MRISTVTLVLAVVATTTACGQLLPENPPRPVPECADVSPSPAADEHVVILLDRTNSTRARVRANTTAAPDYAINAAAATRYALDHAATVSIGGFDGSTSTFEWSLRGMSTASSSVNERRRVKELEQTADCLDDKVREAAAKPPVTAGTDILGALVMAKKQLGPHTSGATILAGTDGFATVGCADLRKVAIGVREEISSVVEGCLAILPKLTGARIFITGIGRSGPDQPRPSTQQGAWMERYWRALCKATHAKSCTVTVDQAAPVAGTNAEPAEITTGSASDRTTGGAEDPRVELPTLEIGRLPSTCENAIASPLPSDVLFDTGSPDLRSDARDALKKIAAEIRSGIARRPAACRGEPEVRIAGHADSRGSDAYGLTLSKRRAKAVATALQALGVRHVTHQGYGETRPRCLPEYRDGAPDYQAMQCNRRVEITIVQPDRQQSGQ